ncbi:MAG: hypothetical protein CBB71_12130 [Rhodopirellula sp. TMED11]|nr:MAG: hypothetical protein CBB71_12130 [Rhodopirellula sp. TMED11]
MLRRGAVQSPAKQGLILGTRSPFYCAQSTTRLQTEVAGLRELLLFFTNAMMGFKIEKAHQSVGSKPL